MPDALRCTALLVKISSQKQPKIVLSAGMKIFEILKLENYKSDINETWPSYISPEHLSYTKT